MLYNVKKMCIKSSPLGGMGGLLVGLLVDWKLKKGERVYTPLATAKIRQKIRLCKSVAKNADDYPKLSNMMDDGSTPMLSSIRWTACDMGPGPHM